MRRSCGEDRRGKLKETRLSRGEAIVTHATPILLLKFAILIDEGENSLHYHLFIWKPVRLNNEGRAESRTRYQYVEGANSSDRCSLKR